MSAAGFMSAMKEDFCYKQVDDSAKSSIEFVVIAVSHYFSSRSEHLIYVNP